MNQYVYIEISVEQAGISAIGSVFLFDMVRWSQWGLESMGTVLIDSEYAGTTIDADTVEFWCGRDLVTEMVPKGDTVDSIFMRGN